MAESCAAASALRASEWEAGEAKRKCGAGGALGRVQGLQMRAQARCGLRGQGNGDTQPWLATTRRLCPAPVGHRNGSVQFISARQSD